MAKQFLTFDIWATNGDDNIDVYTVPAGKRAKVTIHRLKVMDGGGNHKSYVHIGDRYRITNTENGSSATNSFIAETLPMLGGGYYEKDSATAGADGVALAIESSISLQFQEEYIGGAYLAQGNHVFYGADFNFNWTAYENQRSPVALVKRYQYLNAGETISVKQTENSNSENLLKCDIIEEDN